LHMPAQLAMLLGCAGPWRLTREAEPPCHASLHQLLHQVCHPALHGPCLHM